MPDLDYVRVVGRFGIVVRDAAADDPNLEPDTVWCDEGQVHFTPLLTAVKVAGAQPVPATLGQSLIVGEIDTEGYLSLRGTREIQFVDLGSTKVNPYVAEGKATHKVEFLALAADGVPVSLPSPVNVRLSADTINSETGTIDLTLVMPVPVAGGTAQVIGAPGKSAYELWLDLGNTGTVSDFIEDGFADNPSAESASTSAIASAASASESEQYALDAANSATASANSATASQTSAGQAAASATQSANSATASASSATASQTSAAQSATSATNAETSAVESSGSANSSAASATQAATSATQSSNSATASATSATASANSATASQTSADDANFAKLGAEAARDAAVIAQTATESVVADAELYRDQADADRIAAEAARDAALGYRNTTLGYRDAAALSATAAQTAETGAESSATAAATSETNAAASADAAAQSAAEAELAAGGGVLSVNSESGHVTLDAADVGARPAGDVPWAEVSDKPTTFPASTHTHDDRYYTESEIDSQNTANRARANHTGTQPASTITGLAAVATSGSAADLTGILPTSALPPLAVNETFVVATQAAMLALTAQRGDHAIRTDIGKTFVLASDSPGTLADWKEMLAAGGVTSVNGEIGAVSLDAADVGARPSTYVPSWGEVTSKPSTFPPDAHTHDDRYYTETEVNTALATNAANDRARANHTGTQAISTVDGLQTALDGKAASSHTHAKAQITDFAHTHGIADLPVATSGTSNSTQLVRADDARLSDARTPTTHTHDDRYFTETEVNGLLSTNATNDRNRANHTGTQAISTVSGLQSALDAKASSSHTHDDRYYTESETDALLSTNATNDRARANHTGTQPFSTISGTIADSQMPIALGYNPATPTGNDMNGTVQSGLYMSSTAGNAPTTGWVWYRVIRHNDAWVQQEAFVFTNGNDSHAQYIRKLENGAWGPWRQTGLTMAQNDARYAAITHNHSAAQITFGTIAPARLGTGTADSTKFLRGDGTWAAAGGVSEATTTATYVNTGDDSWVPLASVPTGNAGNAWYQTTDPETSTIYVMDAYGDFYSYSVATNTYTALLDHPQTGSRGRSIIFVKTSAGVKSVYCLYDGYDFRRYNVASNTWTQLNGTNGNATYSQLALVGTRIYALGGYDFTYGNSYNYNQYYDTESGNTWVYGANMPGNYYGMHTFEHEGKLWAIGEAGGIDGFNVYDPVSNTWEFVAPMNTRPSGYGSSPSIHGLFKAGYMLYIAYSGGPSVSIAMLGFNLGTLRYDSAGKTAGPGVPSQRQGLPYFHNGDFYLFRSNNSVTYAGVAAGNTKQMWRWNVNIPSAAPLFNSSGPGTAASLTEGISLRNGASGKTGDIIAVGTGDPVYPTGPAIDTYQAVSVRYTKPA